MMISLVRYSSAATVLGLALTGLTQEELAEQVGLTPAFIGHLEAPNIPKALSLDALFDIATALEVSPHKFFNFEDN